MGIVNAGWDRSAVPCSAVGVSTLKPTLGRIPDATTAGPVVAAIGIQLTAVVGP